jgi:hypothetical protein
MDPVIMLKALVSNNGSLTLTPAEEMMLILVEPSQGSILITSVVDKMSQLNSKRFNSISNNINTTFGEEQMPLKTLRIKLNFN